MTAEHHMLEGDDAVARAAGAAALGQRTRLSAAETDALARAVAQDGDERVRAAALAALVRAGDVGVANATWISAAADGSAAVRRRAADIAPLLSTRASGAQVATALVELLGDDDVTVVEAAAWALGELGAGAAGADAVPRLAATVAQHTDPLAREAAVAALGALGERGGLAAILAACHDKPAVRRRAVLALAPFDGDEVSAALQRALEDRDWQVRQAAEDLLGPE
jgi:HEAT repeat protein